MLTGYSGQSLTPQTFQVLPTVLNSNLKYFILGFTYKSTDGKRPADENQVLEVRPRVDPQAAGGPHLPELQVRPVEAPTEGVPAGLEGEGLQGRANEKDRLKLVELHGGGRTWIAVGSDGPERFLFS